MPAEHVDVLVELDSVPDPERVDRLTSALHRELLELDVEGVSRAPGAEAPPGAKGIEIGALVVTLAKSAATLAAVVRALQAWAGRGGRTIKVEIEGDTIELTGATSDQQERLIEAWIARHGIP